MKEFRDRITNPREINSTTYLASAQQLYQWLIQPMEADLQKLKIDTLLFSMDAGLRSLPLAALHDGRKYLIEKYAFSLIPSFSSTDTDYESIKDAPVLAMGMSEFTNYVPLLAVPLEIEAIASNSWRGKFFLNADFTRDNIRKQRASQPFRILHLATHAEFLPGTPKQSYILMWGDDKLHLDELPQMHWNNPPIKLLVLSACRTAIGDEKAELGFAGLAVQAGVNSALASLWYVSDVGTLALMSQFYRHLHTAPIKADALRMAQLAMIRGDIRLENGQLVSSSNRIVLPRELPNLPNGSFSHPFYWSAFTTIGSPW